MALLILLRVSQPFFIQIIAQKTKLKANQTSCSSINMLKVDSSILSMCSRAMRYSAFILHEDILMKIVASSIHEMSFHWLNSSRQRTALAMIELLELLTLTLPHFPSVHSERVLIWLCIPMTYYCHSSENE